MFYPFRGSEPDPSSIQLRLCLAENFSMLFTKMFKSVTSYSNIESKYVLKNKSGGSLCQSGICILSKIRILISTLTWDWRYAKPQDLYQTRSPKNCDYLFIGQLRLDFICHHERWDGTEYPQGLFGEQIPLILRIVSIIDSYDAITQDRTYRKAMSHEGALVKILDCTGSQFAPELTGTFTEIMNCKQ